MANEQLARADVSEALSETDYQAFCAALEASARGRAFLAEHARRARSADTDMLLSALKRLEGQVAANVASAPSAVDTISPELRSLLDAIRGMQAELDAASLAMQVAKLGSLLEVIQQRLESIVALPRGDGPTADVAPTPAAVPKRQPDAEAEAFPVQVEVAFAAPETPAIAMSEADFSGADQAALPAMQELPSAVQEPVTAAQTPPVMALEDPPEPEGGPVAVPEIYWYDSQSTGAAAQPATTDNTAAGLAIAAVVESAVRPADEAPVVTVIKAGTMPPPTPFAGEDFSAGAPMAKPAPQDGPLSDIMALSEEERLALFT